MHLKKLAVAIGVAAAMSQGAHAAISTGYGVNNQPGGELFLTVFDPVNVVTYTRDLGVPVIGTDFSTFSLDLAADSAFTSAFASTTGLLYSVVGGNVDEGLSATTPDGAAVLFTSNGSQSAILAIDGAAGGLNNIYDNIRTYAGGTNGIPGVSSSFAANNSSTVSGTGTPSFAGGFFTNGTLGASIGSPAQNTAAAVGTPLAFYRVSYDVNTFENTNAKLASNFLLDANGRLTYGSAAPVVPLPAGVWLLGSALAGLVGVARRRQAAV